MSYGERPGRISTVRVSSAFGKRHAAVSADVARLISRIGWARAKDMFEPSGVDLDGSPVYIMSRDGFMLVSGTWNSVKALRTKLVLLDEMEWQAHCVPNKTNQNNVRTNAHCNGQPININVTVNLGQNGNAMPRFSL